MVPIQGSVNILHHTVGIKANTELFYGDEPAYHLNLNIPDLKITTRLDNDFRISLGLDVPFQVLMRLRNNNWLVISTPRVTTGLKSKTSTFMEVVINSWLH
jgi:hypothetical protein